MCGANQHGPGTPLGVGDFFVPWIEFEAGRALQRTPCYVFSLFRALRKRIDDRSHRDIRQYDWLETIAWWETRRVFYNLVLILVGMAGVFLMLLCGALAEPLVGEAIGIPDGPILIPFGAIAFLFLANLFYTGGWIAELLLCKFKADGNTNTFGVRAFRLGVKFSILVTLLPAVLSWAVFLFSLATGRRAGPADQ
jgi:hypothetical protein